MNNPAYKRFVSVLYTFINIIHDFHIPRALDYFFKMNHQKLCILYPSTYVVRTWVRSSMLSFQRFILGSNEQSYIQKIHFSVVHFHKHHTWLPYPKSIRLLFWDEPSETVYFVPIYLCREDMSKILDAKFSEIRFRNKWTILHSKDSFWCCTLS